MEKSRGMIRGRTIQDIRKEGTVIQDHRKERAVTKVIEMSLNGAKKREESTRGTEAAERTTHVNSKRNQEGMTSFQNKLILSLTDTMKEILTIDRGVVVRSMNEGTDIEVTTEKKRFIKKEKSFIGKATEKRNHATKLDKKIPSSRNMSLIISGETPVTETVTMISPTTIPKEREKKKLAEKMMNRGNLLRRVAETVKGSQALPRS